MTTMHIRRNRGNVEKEEVKDIRLVSLSGMKFYPISLQLVRRLCDADGSAHFQSQIREENKAGKVTKGRVYFGKVTFGFFSGEFDKRILIFFENKNQKNKNMRHDGHHISFTISFF